MYTLMFGSHKIPVYCHMGNFGCGGGGWTLAMKIDGTKVRIFEFIFFHQFSSRAKLRNILGSKWIDTSFRVRKRWSRSPQTLVLKSFSLVLCVTKVSLAIRML